MPATLVKVIKPKRLSSKKIRGHILAELNKQAKVAVEMLSQPLSTWSDPPRIEALEGYKGGDVTLLVGPVGNLYQVQKFNWLDQGTSVRHAILSSDWQSKTTVGSWTSGPGAGRVVKVNRNYQGRGIQARGWLKKLEIEMTPRYKRAVERALKAGSEDLDPPR